METMDIAMQWRRLARLAMGCLIAGAGQSGAADAVYQPLCENAGRMVGEQAYARWEAARTGFYSHGGGPANPELQERWAKYDYMNKVEQAYGKAWLAIAEDVFLESKAVPSAQAARDLGYALCMARDAVPAIVPTPIKRRGG